MVWWVQSTLCGTIYFLPWMLWQNRDMWSRRFRLHQESKPKAFNVSAGISNLQITPSSVDNINDWVQCCKPINFNYYVNGWFMCTYHATARLILMNKWFAGCGNVKLVFELHKNGSSNALESFIYRMCIRRRLRRLSDKFIEQGPFLLSCPCPNFK